MSLLLKFDDNQSLAGSQLTTQGWSLPANLTQQQWLQAGEMLARVEQSKQWWLGDWWNAGVRWGQGREACEAIGVDYQTAKDCGMVVKKFELSRRRDNLSFKHHREVCPLQDDSERDRFLDWCEEPIAQGGKPRSTRELREAIHSYLDEQGWTDEERERRQWVESGRTVVANQRGDEHLIQWAKFKNLAIKVDRQSKWGNPFEMDKDGTRDEVCDHYEVYWRYKPSLQKELAELRGKVLLCWCHPERCHAHFLADEANAH